MAQYELNIRDYLQIIQKRKLIILGVFLLVFISTIIYTHKQIPIYRVSALIKIMERKTFAGLLTEWITWTPGDPIASHARIIRSYPVIERVVKELNLVSSDAPPEQLTLMVTSTQNKVSSDVIGETNVIRITLVDTDPMRATLIANKIAEVYIDESLKEKNKQARTVREFIQEQLKQVENKLISAEEAIKEFKESGEATGIAVSLENKLADLETERSRLLRIYTERHPDIARINEEITLVKEQLKLLPEKELQYARLTREAGTNEKLYRNLQEKFEEARIAEIEKVSDVTIVNPAITPRSPISPNKMLNGLLGIVIGLVLGLTAGFTAEQMDTSIGKIEDVESILNLPALGVIPYLEVEGEKKNFRQKLWPKRYRGEERIAHLSSQLIVHYSLTSTATESYRILRTNIQSEVIKGEKGKILMMSSAGPEEGKSITVCNLAIIFAQEGNKTLLVDADLRRSVVNKIFGLKNREPGLTDILMGKEIPQKAIRTITDVLMGELGFDTALKTPGLDNLNILTAGFPTTIPSETLSSASMTTLLEKLKAEFDVILLDSPPILAVADPLILAPKLDGVVLVYKVGKTARSVILRAKTQLQEVNAKLVGVVLNNISPEVELYYGYYQRYKYYKKYYGEKTKPEA